MDDIAIDPALVGLADDPLAAVGIEDKEEDEWEYEYSTTEVETYYLTVDLSYPEFKAAPLKDTFASRGRHRKWEKPPHDPSNIRAPGAHAHRVNEHDDDDEADVEQEDELDPDIDPELQHAEDDVTRQTEQEGLDSDQAEEIQILDLHSKRPMFSYRGRVFEGQWSEMIGTDMVFAQHGGSAELPTLRHLPGDVDLLAASSSRITTKEKMLVPKSGTVDTLAPIKKEWNINIPIGRGKTTERIQQANFLERMIALKIQKGHTDQVTVYAKDGEGKQFRDDRDPDYRPRRKKPITDPENYYVESTSGRLKKKRKRVTTGRPPGRPRWKHIEGSERAELAAAPPLSTPTPLHWEDLTSGQRDAGREGESGEEEDEDEEESDHDTPMANA